MDTVLRYPFGNKNITRVQNSGEAANANRTMWTVTLERADSRQILHESWGGFPEVSPEPEE